MEIPTTSIATATDNTNIFHLFARAAALVLAATCGVISLAFLADVAWGVVESAVNLNVGETYQLLASIVGI